MVCNMSSSRQIALSKTEWWIAVLERSKIIVVTGNAQRNCNMWLEWWETGLGSSTTNGPIDIGDEAPNFLYK